MLMLAVVLGVKYIVFDRDDDQTKDDDEVATTTMPAVAAQTLSASDAVNNSISAGQSLQIDKTLHSETADDNTPVGSSLFGDSSYSAYFALFFYHNSTQFCGYVLVTTCEMELMSNNFEIKIIFK